ncbi:MAG: 5-formyltetrahydrofolate cyclo-ligase family protein [Pelotomaculum sp. PtaB.Bin104]|nr:MAG: 5-formyltetrahydrofolate cyclo-ligase family protein [Pelotomaculum sp. PtaB.Bin104]
MSKEALRKKVLQERMALSPEEVARKSDPIMEKIIKMKEFSQASTVMVYLDFRNEVQTGALVQQVLADGKRLVVPRTEVTQHQLLPCVLKNYPGDLQPGAWGILEPKADCVRPVKPAEINLIIVPGVAFDLCGNRLGYGGGYYDRFLLQTGPDALFIAPAFELQILPQVFPGEHDVPVHYLVTEKRLVNTGR